MFQSFKIAASIVLLFTISACGSLPTKKTVNQKNVPSPSSLSADKNSAPDSLQVRTEADYNFILAEVYSREGNTARAIELFEKVLAIDQNSPSLHTRLSAEYLKLNKMAEAISHAELAVQKKPEDIDAHLFLGGLYSTKKLYAKAISQYNIVLQLQPDNVEAPIYIGSIYSEQKDIKKAVQYFESLLKNASYEAPHMAYYYIGLIHQDQEGAQHKLAAERAFKKSLRLKPDFEDALLSLANFYLQQNERHKSLSLCLEFQKQDRFNLKVADLISQIYIENGEPTKAFEQLEIIANNTDATLEVQMKMALILIETKRFNQAATKLKEIVAKYSTSDSARYYLAAVYEEIGQTEKAIREYMLVPPSSGHFSEAVVHAAHLLKGLGKLNQALDVAEKGIKIKADQPQVYTMYASLLDAKSDYLGAARVLEEGLAKFSQNAQLLFQHALVLDRLGKKDSMIEQMKKVLEIEPNHVQSMSYLAFTLAELDLHLPEAERLARRAFELEPKDGYILDTLGWVLYKQKKYSESIKFLEKAYEYQSSASIIAEHLADAYLMQSMLQEAKAMYNKAVALTTDEGRALQIRKKLLKLVM